MTKIGCYVRVSTDTKRKKKKTKQPTKHIQTTKMQRAAIRQWAINAHISPDSIKFYEDKKSGKSMQGRDSLSRLLKAVDRGQIDTVIVYDLSRLARNMIDGLKVLSDLASKGIRIVSVSESIDFSSTTGMLIAQILLSVAEWQRKNQNEKIRAGMQTRIDEGLPVGRPRNNDKLKQIKKLLDSGIGVTAVAHKLNCSRQNIYDSLKRIEDMAA